MFRKVLIANRGEIARRIIRTARRPGIVTVAVYSEADAGAAHVEEADQAIAIGPAPAAQSYLHAEALIAAARESGAEAVHPGYGFLSERDCSVQRRFQKVVEETPSPGLSPSLRGRMFSAAVAGAESLGYRGAGTFEFLVSGDAFVFLEVNARLQVEHPVTEMVCGLDIVEAQFRIAAGLPVDPPPAPRGHAIELRVYAEDPVRFLPGPGRIVRWSEPKGEGVRVDSGYREGDVVTPHYDPLLAKLCVHAADRATAIERARRAVHAFVIEGPKSNLAFLTKVLTNPEFVSGDYDTGLVARLRLSGR